VSEQLTSITIMQAVLIGLFWWFKTNYYGQTFTCAISNCCLPGALFVGIVLGDVPNAMIIGASVQLIYLGILGPGGNLPQDPTLAALVSTAIVLKSGMPVETAFAIAVPVGLLGAQILNLIRLINTTWIHMADKYAENGNTRGIYLAGLVYPSLARIPITVIPVALAVYYGSAYIERILDAIPVWLMNGLTVAGGMLPALGFAIVVNVIGQRYLLPYFAAGFFILQFTGIGILPLAIFGVIIAYLHVLFTNSKKVEGGTINGTPG
jgi:PTS system mannose-specific IIC component